MPGIARALLGSVAKGAWRHVAVPAGRGIYKGSEVAAKVGFTAAFAPVAIPASIALRAVSSAGRGSLRFGWDQLRRTGKNRVASVTTGLFGKGGLGSDSAARRLWAGTRIMSGAALPFGLGTAWGVNKIGNMNIVRDPRDRDPVNAMHLTQSLYNTLR